MAPILFSIGTPPGQTDFTRVFAEDESAAQTVLSKESGQR